MVTDLSKQRYPAAQSRREIDKKSVLYITSTKGLGTHKAVRLERHWGRVQRWAKEKEGCRHALKIETTRDQIEFARMLINMARGKE